ncbi:MAG: hypothetical protein AB1346_06825 [Thermodesulfobacteriota bacterium]
MRRDFRLLSSLFCLLLLPACGPANQLRILGDIGRPPFSGPLPQGPPRMAVLDFSYAAPAEGPGVIGRDFDRVRQVVWDGDPGRTMADLLAGALAEQGVPTVRLKAGAPPPDNVQYLISGTIRRFEVNVRRGDIMKVSDEANVSVTVNVSGTGMPASYETTVSSAATVQELFALPSQLQHALLTAANSAAEEAVRGIRQSAASGAFPKGGAGGDGNRK